MPEGPDIRRRLVPEFVLNLDEMAAHGRGPAINTHHLRRVPPLDRQAFPPQLMQFRLQMRKQVQCRPAGDRSRKSASQDQFWAVRRSSACLDGCSLRGGEQRKILKLLSPAPECNQFLVIRVTTINQSDGAFAEQVSRLAGDCDEP
jgi:hypothetical protein